MAYIYNTQCVGLFSTAAAVRCVTGCGVWWRGTRRARPLALLLAGARPARARSVLLVSRSTLYMYIHENLF